MTTKHTPGPWEAAYNGDPVCVGATDADGFYRFVAMTLPAPEVSPDPTEEDYANARLIAAAPDMLAALESAAVDLDVMASNLSDEPNGLTPQDCAEICATMASTFRDLVRKATQP